MGGCGRGLHSGAVREAASRTIAMFPLCLLQVPLNCWLRNLPKTVCDQCVDRAFFRVGRGRGRMATLDRADLSGERRGAARWRRRPFRKRAFQKSTRHSCMKSSWAAWSGMHVIRESSCNARIRAKLRVPRGPNASITCAEKRFARSAALFRNGCSEKYTRHSCMNNSCAAKGRHARISRE
jgi:hypothetical protein